MFWNNCLTGLEVTEISSSQYYYWLPEVDLEFVTVWTVRCRFFETVFLARVILPHIFFREIAFFFFGVFVGTLNWWNRKTFTPSSYRREIESSQASGSLESIIGCAFWMVLFSRLSIRTTLANLWDLCFVLNKETLYVVVLTDQPQWWVWTAGIHLGVAQMELWEKKELCSLYSMVVNAWW